MKYLETYKIFEKTSLINIGVPYSVMKSIQINYELSTDAEWIPLRYKKDILSTLKQKKNNLIVSICKDKIFISFSYDNEFYLETFELIDSDDFGDENWKKVNRIKATLYEINSIIEKGCKSYLLISGNWLPEYSSERKMKKEESTFDKITNEFKIYFAENFTRIVKKIYGKKANVVTDIIINHLKNIKTDLSDKDIRDVLFQNVERAKEVDIFKKKQKEKDPYELYSNIIKDNSLTIFNEKLFEYEDDYSDKYKEYLNIPIMLERWGLDKIQTSFCLYLYSGKLMEL